MFAGIWGMKPPHPSHPRWESRFFQLQESGRLQHRLHSQSRGPEWFSEWPKVTQLKSSKASAWIQDGIPSRLLVHSVGTPPHTHTEEPLTSA